MTIFTIIAIVILFILVFALRTGLESVGNRLEELEEKLDTNSDDE